MSLKDGSLVLGKSEFSLWSGDQGKTWYTRPPLPAVSILQLLDGSFYALDGDTRTTEKPGVFLGKRTRLRSLTNMQTSLRWSEVPVTVKRWTPLTGDNGTEVSTLGLGGPIVEMGDGTWLKPCYGNFQGDTVPIEGFAATKGEKWFKYRSYLLRSVDQGKSWRYFSTIAYDGETGQESFCEPAMVHLGGGELLAVMRTGRFAPMYQARSLDGGKTWQRPKSLHTLGLSPAMVLLGDGALVCTFGWRPMKIVPEMVAGGPYPGAADDYQKRYKGDVGIEDPSAAAGDYVMVSLDKGHTWSKPRRIATPLTIGYTLLAATGRDSCFALSRRIVIPGESQASVAKKWEKEWQKWQGRAREVIEGRHITVR